MNDVPPTDKTLAVLRHIEAGEDLNGELDALPEPWRFFGQCMVREPVEKRQRVIQGLLRKVPNGPAIEKRFNEIDLSEPLAAEEHWIQDPRPVRCELRAVPEMTPEILPVAFRGWLTDIAERVSCPLEYPAVGAIVALATVVGRKIAIRPKRYDDWTVVPNLWGSIIGRPGVLKTPALKEATKPLLRLEAAARENHAAKMAAYRVAVSVSEVKLKTARKNLEDAAKKKIAAPVLEALAKEVEDAAPPPEPILRRYTTSDPTVEKIGELIRDHQSIGLFRDELVGWVRSFDKVGRECDRTFYLESWNGNGMPFTYDRIGRGEIHIPSPCVSILGGMQPGPLRSLVRVVFAGEDADDGFISRFQLLLWPDLSSNWVNVDRWPNTNEKNKAFEVYRYLDETNPADMGATEDEDGGPPFLRFDEDAQELFDSWRTDLEAALRAPDQNPLIESHLAKYRSLMPSLALLFHLVGVASGDGVGPVSLRATQAAIAWCDLLKEHALRVYSCISEPNMDAAIALSEKIKSGALPSPFSPRDVYRKHWSDLDTSAAVDHAVAILEDLGWLRAVVTKETGGRDRVDVIIHPKLPRREEA